MTERAIIPAQKVETDYPLIDSDPHISRVIRYARPYDWACAAFGTAFMPGGYWLMDYLSPLESRRSYRTGMRMMYVLGPMAGFMFMYINSTLRFLGWSENAREVEMDMKEMVQRVKDKKPLYGESRLDPYMQGVMARTSTYSVLMIHAFPMFNFVNHNHHGVDTIKYYRAAEEELEREERERKFKQAFAEEKNKASA